MMCASIVFFFLEKKTAYEIRPRDWSSDVCSSDLSDRGNANGHTDFALARYQGGDVESPMVVSTSPANGAVVATGPRQIRVNFSEAMYRNVIPTNLSLDGPGRGSASISAATFLDNDTAVFTIAGAWGTGEVTLNTAGPFPHELASNGLVPYAGNFTILGAPSDPGPNGTIA